MGKRCLRVGHHEFDGLPASSCWLPSRVVQALRGPHHAELLTPGNVFITVTRLKVYRFVYASVDCSCRERHGPEGTLCGPPWVMLFENMQ